MANTREQIDSSDAMQESRSAGISLGFILVDVSRLFRINFDKAFEQAGIDLTPGEGRTLVYLADVGKCRQATLASRMCIEPMSVSAYVDRLFQNGLITRVPDPVDRRAKLVDLTPRGRDLLRIVYPIIDAVYDQSIAGIKLADLDVLYSNLLNMRDNLSNHCRSLESAKIKASR